MDVQPCRPFNHHKTQGTKGVAPKTEWKYRADLDKFKAYGLEANIRFARRFSENHLYCYRKWLKDKNYADKTVEGTVVLVKQMFKWAWRQKLIKDYAPFCKHLCQPPCCIQKGPYLVGT